MKLTHTRTHTHTLCNLFFSARFSSLPLLLLSVVICLFFCVCNITTEILSPESTHTAWNSIASVNKNQWTAALVKMQLCEEDFWMYLWQLCKCVVVHDSTQVKKENEHFQCCFNTFINIKSISLQVWKQPAGGTDDSRQVPLGFWHTC